MDKVHTIMRNLPKYLGTRDGKKEFLKIADEVETVLPQDECVDSKGEPLSLEDVEAKWATKFKQPIIHRLRNAAKVYESEKERETPLGLLEAAYKKLTHNDMDLKAIAFSELKTARTWVIDIRERTRDLEKAIYDLEKAGEEFFGK